MPSHGKSTHIHWRSPGLIECSCAISHQSSSYFNKSIRVHESLMNTEVFMSDNMKTHLRVAIEGGQTEVAVESDRPLVKVDKTEHGLSICVPSDISGLRSCYLTELPAEIVKILGISNSRADKQVYRILNDTETTLEAILLAEDIPQENWLERLELPEATSTPGVQSSTRLDVDGLLVTPSRSRSETAAEPRTPDPPSYISRSQIGGVFPATPPHSISSDRILDRVIQNNAYKDLLKNVVQQARRIPQKFRAGLDINDFGEALHSAHDPAFNAVNLEQVLGGGYDSSFSENAKIGAAGELFVFELLRALRTPSFTLDNWQSRIRSYVNVLDDYYDLQAWNQPEVSDIMYTNSSSTMEHFLRRHGHNVIPEFLRSDSQIQYLIEVKATTGPCVTPFFMSKNQYQLIRQHALASQEGRPRTVFVIMRVYNLLSNNIGLEIYVDPWSLKDTTLEFVADPWKVIPPHPLQAGRSFEANEPDDSDEEL